MLGDEELYKKYLLRPHYNPLKVIESIHKELGELCQDMNDLNEDEIKEQISNINERKKEFLNTNIKFILTDIGINEIGRIGNLLTNIWNFFDKKFPYGALHAGLMINETIIQWGKGPLGAEIIFPSTDLRNILFSIEIESTKKRKEIKKLFAAIEAIAIGIPFMMYGLLLGGLFLGVIGGITSCVYYAFSLSWEIKKISEEELNKIAKKCVFYNRRMHYNAIRNNCQNFVNDILNEIDAPFNPSGELRKVIDKISQNGYSSFSFKGKEFKLRREFDEYVKSINFRDLCIDDKKLLLCYKSLYDDRLRIIKKEESQRPLTEEETLEKEKYITDDENFWKDLLLNNN